MAGHSTPNTHLSGPLRAVVLAVGLIACGTILAIFALGIPIRFEQLNTVVGPRDPVVFPGLSPELEAGNLSRLGPAEAEILKGLGISITAYAAYILFFDVALVLLGAVIAAVIFWRQSDNWLAVWIAYAVILLGTNGASFVGPSLAQYQPALFTVYLLFGWTGMASQFQLCCLSPDGRYIPVWTWTLAAGFTGLLLGAGLYSLFALPNVFIGLAVFLLVAPIWIVLLGVGAVAQVYRYRRISNPVQRQQTKWIAVGLSMTIIGFVLNVSFQAISFQTAGAQRLILNLVRAPLVNLFMMVFALGLAFSIFRYRLWDIDLIIRRTTTYAALTALLAVIYFSVVVFFQSVFAAFGARQSEFSIVVSTLVIAALVRPLQSRVQHFIDRRFYRAKYDMERTLAGFTRMARDEVDVDRLADSLLDVVGKTMRPERASLWLRGPTTRG